MKETLTSKARNLIKENPSIKPKEMAEKLGLPLQRVYVMRSLLKKKAKKKVVAKKVATPVAEPKLTSTVMNVWEKRLKQLESENNRLRHLYMDKQAIIKYLEAKIDLLQGYGGE